MTRRASVRARAVGAALAGVTLVVGADPSAAQKPSAERPSYSVGHQWMRSDATYVLTRMDRDVYVFSAGAGNEVHVTKDLGIARIVLDRRVEYDVEPVLGLGWPLEVGKWGTRQAAWRLQPPRPLSQFTGGVRTTFKVDAYEDVRVAAGTFKAFRIAYSIETVPIQLGSGVHFGQFTLWYAPELQLFVKAEGSFTGLNWELAGAHKPAPSPPAPTVAAAPPDAEAPKIVLNYPPADTQVEREAIVITGLVTDNVDVARVQVAVNGMEVARSRDIGVVGRGYPIRATAALRPGDNLIEITVADRAGNVTQLVRTVTRLVPGPAAPPASKVADRWAVVIGVGEYDEKRIPALRFAVRDAEAMYQFLTAQGGYAKDHVLLLTDNTPQKPTLLNIKRALGDFLARRAGRDDMVLIYYAGHGAPEVDVAGAESDGLSKYLVPRDGDPESLYTTALPMEEVQRIFARIPSERVVMLLDTCYSGTAGGRTFARQQVRATGMNDQFLERLTRSRGRVIMTASGPNEVALELPELGHGLFTYYVLEGLRGKADRSGDGLVTVSELYEYVEDQVDRAARLAGGRQRPLMKGEIEGALPLTRLGR